MDVNVIVNLNVAKTIPGLSASGKSPCPAALGCVAVENFL